MGYFSSEIAARTRFEEDKLMARRRMKLSGALGTRAMTRVRRTCWSAMTHHTITYFIWSLSARCLSHIYLWLIPPPFLVHQYNVSRARRCAEVSLPSLILLVSGYRSSITEGDILEMNWHFSTASAVMGSYERVSRCRRSKSGLEVTNVGVGPASLG